MTPYQHQVWQAARARGIDISQEEFAILRRISITLSRWAEGQCGSSSDWGSWAIERDEQTGMPYRVTYPHNGETYRVRIPDRETGALKRLADLAKSKGFYWYHQTDPRGIALYINNTPLASDTYTYGIAIGR